MQTRAAFWTLLLAVLLLTWFASPASAGIDTWHFGAGFRVGGIDFRVGYAEAGPYGSSFYFEAAKPFRYRGYACSSYCYRQGPRYYHHPSCSAVHHHFGLHGYAPGYYMEHYGPPIAYPPPAYIYGPPGWYVRYYGHYDHQYRDRRYRDRHHKDKHYSGRHYRGRDYRNRSDRYRHDRDRHDRDRHNRGGHDRGRRDR